MRTNPIKAKSLAAVTVVVLTGWAGAGTAAADPGSAGNGQHGAAGQGAAHQGGRGAKHDDGPKPGNGPKDGHGPKHDGPKPGNGPKNDGPKPGNGPKNGHGPGNSGVKPGQGPKSNAAGDPAGNNGTVKITGPGAPDGTPNNVPHPGCTFQIEWYGFDEGDYYSTVSFASQAPTADTVISGTSPSRVFVGGDPASGAGTATGLDAVQAYTLSFAGTPHPKQGYHVKVTVATPFSQGNDTKSKVFWVEPCETGADEVLSADSQETPTDAGVMGVTTSNDAEQPADVAGTTAVEGTEDTAAVPTAVDAGEGDSQLEQIASRLPLVLVGLGAALGGIVLLRRRQRA